MADGGVLLVNVRVSLPDGVPAIRFEAVALAELASSLRSLVFEHPASCSFTSFRLEVCLSLIHI